MNNSEKSNASIQSLEEGNFRPLVPRIGNVMIKGMLNSPEYCSNYSRMVSSVQFEYWNILSISEKIEFWLFYLTGKQRIKLWNKMKFCEKTVNKYVQENLPDIGKYVKGDITLINIWDYLNNMYKQIDAKGKKNTELPEIDIIMHHKISLVKS